jgi:hypothetical protein
MNRAGHQKLLDDVRLTTYHVTFKLDLSHLLFEFLDRRVASASPLTSLSTLKEPQLERLAHATRVLLLLFDDSTLIAPVLPWQCRVTVATCGLVIVASECRAPRQLRDTAIP